MGEKIKSLALQAERRPGRLDITWDDLEQLLAPYGISNIRDVQFTSDGVNHVGHLRDKDSTIIVFGDSDEPA